ncbi:DUF748 domain-containing protein [Variovorax terrae]|uniref:DUF748 domain-containing protein n=1 Tax=Variovorax terrae TaxID=2923278 RepID=A0A9X2ALL3_9BURK|nr:DUF748 domain-containing protein [Variovorax terrae]MCJ0762813.1 DUF748 domain-containing protein [Variovorax terrae]
MDIDAVKNNKWFRRVAWAVGGVLALWGIGWLAVPPLVKSQAEKIATEKLGRQVTLGAVDFKPWTLELTLNDLAIAGANGAPPQLLIKRIYIDGELQSLLRLAPVVDAVEVEAPQLRLTHLSDGHYDIDDILARLSQPSGQPPGEPPRFALYNLALTGGSVDFTDQAVHRTHELRELNLSVPFLSNLPSQREVKVEPRLAFRLNGSSFDSSAVGTPFTQARKTDASIKLAGFDLTPYLGYIPASVPVKLQAATLDADVRVAFEQTPRIAVRLSGTVQASRVKLADARAQELLGFETLKLTLDDVRPFEQTARLAAVELDSPSLAVRRDKAGRLNLDLSGTPEAPQKTAASDAAAKTPTAKVSPAGGWKIDVAKVAVRGGAVAWSDDGTAPQARLALRNVALDASGIAVPVAQPLQFSGAAVLDSQPGQASLSFSGTATDIAASVTATVGGVPLAAAAPYLASFITPALGGTLDADLALQWKAPAGPGQAPGLQVQARQLVLNQLALTQGRAPLASVKKIELAQAQLDLAQQTLSVEKLALTQPRAKVGRGEDRRWMFEHWLKAGSAAPAAAPGHRPGGAADKPWGVALGEVTLDAGALSYLDQATARPVAFELTGLKLQMKNVAPDSAKPSPLTVSARLGAGRTEPGRLDYRGTLALKPLAAQGRVDAQRLPLHAFAPYFADALNIELLRADASFKGQVRYADGKAGPALKLSGDTALEEFRANSVPVDAPPQEAAAGKGGLAISEELLSWKALSLRGLEVSLTPGTATTVDVRETTLSDFFARVIINENGRINLQDLVKSSAATGTATVPAATTGAAVATNSIATNDPATRTSGQKSASTPVPAGAAAASVAAGTATAAPAPVIRVGPVSLINGKVLFTDHFVKPNYSADLSDLTGKLSAFSSVSPQGSPQLADLELRGRAEGTASLEILGKLNPLAKPLALDIKGKVRDLELPPLSPYSIKYAGHGIERGKLSVDVAYLVKPDGQLTASNNLVLNQLSFGDEVKGAPASLPVKLAVALLADRNGVIDINLPISGSLNDPQFSLGPIIFKVIVNLIVKAITSPFSLLASAFGGGGDELSMVAFAPGSAMLSPDARQGLDKVANALTDRPSLKMTVVGTASLQAERDGYKHERLKALVQAEKRRAAVLAGQTATGVITVSEAEYPALLKEVYKRADMPKPRNLIGMAKDLPPAEMEALLLANIPVSDDVMRELALQRGVAVKDYLATKNLPPERLFLGAAKAVAPEAKWSPRAELSLATQ